MELSQKENTKRIAKNTLMLYVRMLFGMLVSLYTSRVVLQALGVEDYGIYNVVGGVVAMFYMISNSLSSSVSRFLTFELGKGNREALKKVFSTSLSIYVVLSFVIVLLGETIGLWFLNTHMTIPENRLYAANWVFQASIFTLVINLLSVPFSASIVSHERMSAFAYNGTTRPVANEGETLTVGENTISGCIPYLYDFNLKPTFTVSEGMTVSVNGTLQTSGESEQNFSRPVVYTVSNGIESQDYTVTVTNSGLPVVVLAQSGGGTVEWAEAGINVREKDADWVETDKMTVYKADGSADVEETACGIRLRGNSTQEFPKKPFAIKLASKAKVLGMPKHKRWVLLANWMDRTMLRNAVAFEVAHQTENAFADGIGWNPHGYNVEVIMDGRHVGNYYLCEQIKIDGDRVNIQDCYEDVLKENPNPTVADCGYLLEFDDNYDEVNKFHTGRGLPCMFKDIVSDELFDAVKARIEGIEANLEAGNYDAAYNDLDIHSVIDYFFIQELAFNDEYKHPKSVYMYIDGLGKLTAGPVWDFDWQTFVNYDNVEAMINKYGCDTYRCRKGDEWLYGASKLAEKPTWPWQDYDYENDKPYMWYPLLFKDANFRQAVQERWTIIYPALLTVESKIEELADQNRLSDTFNSVMWPQIQVKSSGTTAFNGDEEMTFDEAVASMKQAYRERLNWMNTNIMNGSFVIDAE